MDQNLKTFFQNKRTSRKYYDVPAQTSQVTLKLELVNVNYFPILPYNILLILPVSYYFSATF